jgi:3-phosphoshikimate 1-carboxyvinyltransferase
MSLLLNNTSVSFIHKSIKISGSKSINNRLLILKQFYYNISLKNKSNSNDVKMLENALISKKDVIDIHHAGTAMRFLTSYFASKNNANIILTGSNRMKERPIKDLVDALQSLGCQITYIQKNGFPPLKIKGKKIGNNKVCVNGNISSQFITSLLLIAPSLTNGLELTITNELTSKPYVLMTLSILNKLGIETSFKNNVILVKPKSKIDDINFTVESDWSSASYYYSALSILEKGTIHLSSFQKNSIQGDAELINIYKKFGVKTTFNVNEITLSKIKNFKTPSKLEIDCSSFPDLAQTILVSCFAKGISCKLTGLKTLKIKETDRIVALKTELEKFGAKITSTNESIELFVTEPLKRQNSIIAIQTYQDHRMAMAFAPLSFITPIRIENPEVVEKSYPNFWVDFEFSNNNL